MERTAAGERLIQVSSEERTLEGTLHLPARALGLVLFAHGSGSSRFSPRNRFVARLLHDAGFATVLIDLLTSGEDELDQATRSLRFNIPLLGQRLIAILDWLTTDAAVRTLPVGLFGASTGATAALIAAVHRPQRVQAVVSRGGRPDLAQSVLTQVRAPTLLIVGEHDLQVLALNRDALAQLPEPKALEIVPGATHLFEEPGCLEQVAKLAAGWYAHHLPSSR